jgi:hypothetical protein
MLKDIQTTIVWHDASKELPKRGGTYLVAKMHIDPFLGGRGYITSLDFSAKVQKWNCTDETFGKKEIDTSHALDGIVAWAEHLPLYEEIYNAFHEGVKHFDAHDD